MRPPTPTPEDDANAFDDLGNGGRCVASTTMLVFVIADVVWHVLLQDGIQLLLPLAVVDGAPLVAVGAGAGAGAFPSVVINRPLSPPPYVSTTTLIKIGAVINSSGREWPATSRQS